MTGQEHPGYPSTPPAAYAVLDCFHITDVWPEKLINIRNEEVKTWRIRFEKIDLQKPSWWMPPSHHGAYCPAASTAASTSCQFCEQESKEIFTEGWTCLNHHCGNFFVFPGSQNVIHPNHLTYTETFLNERTPFVGQTLKIKPEMPSQDFADTNLHGTELVSRRGFVCPDCGCCSRRLFWNRLVCENQRCGLQWPALMRPYPQEILARELVKFNALMATRRVTNKVNAGITDDTKDTLAVVLNRQCLKYTREFTFGSYVAQQYYLPDAAGNIIGSFTLFTSNDAINSAENGPDSLFRDLEVIDIGLKRNPAAVAGHKLEGLTRHFQQNFVSNVPYWPKRCRELIFSGCTIQVRSVRSVQGIQRSSGSDFEGLEPAHLGQSVCRQGNCRHSGRSCRAYPRREHATPHKQRFQRAPCIRVHGGRQYQRMYSLVS